MEKIARKDITAVVIGLLEVGAKKATKFVSPKLVIKATRRFMDARDKIVEIHLTVGAPNYAERQFIKAALKAGEPFPVKKVQFKMWTKKVK